MTSSLKLFIILYYIKQIDSKLPCVCLVIDHRGRQNVIRTSVIHSAAPRVPLFCSYHILTSSVIYYWTDARQLGIYLLNRSKMTTKCGQKKKVAHKAQRSKLLNVTFLSHFDVFCGLLLNWPTAIWNLFALCNKEPKTFDGVVIYASVLH